MDARAEGIAWVRYGLIAGLVPETLPRGELHRRAREMAGAATASPVQMCCSLGGYAAGVRYRNAHFQIPGIAE